MTRTLLAVDVGGTKCELAVFPADGHSYTPLARKRYRSAEHERLEDIIKLFIDEAGYAPVVSCMGIAGVVSEGHARVTNLPWTISEHSLANEFGFEQIRLINDLTAVCASIGLLKDEEVQDLLDGQPQPGQLIGVVAPGTGLGEGLLVQNDTYFFPRGSEGGHTDFGPVNEEQAKLLRWMLERRERVSYESLIAGPGVPSLYEFYRDGLGLEEAASVAKEMSGVQDRTPVIFNNAFAPNPCPLCRKAVDLFLDILGAEAGNLALKLYARGGIYIGGGIVPRIIEKADFSGFRRNFLAKGKMAALMKTIPVKVILKKDAALIGAARVGQEHLVR